MRGRVCLEAAADNLRISDQSGGRQQIKQAFFLAPQLVFERYFLHLAISAFLGNGYILRYRKFRHLLGRRQ